MYEFWHVYVKSKIGQKTKLCYMNIGSFIVYKKEIYKDIAEDVEPSSDTQNFELDRLLPK